MARQKVNAQKRAQARKDVWLPSKANLLIANRKGRDLRFLPFLLFTVMLPRNLLRRWCRPPPLPSAAPPPQPQTCPFPVPFLINAIFHAFIATAQDRYHSSTAPHANFDLCGRLHSWLCRYFSMIRERRHRASSASTPLCRACKAYSLDSQSRPRTPIS